MAFTDKATVENAEAITSHLEDAVEAMTKAKVALAHARRLVIEEDTERLNAESIISLRGAAQVLQDGLVKEATLWRVYAENRRSN